MSCEEWVAVIGQVSRRSALGGGLAFVVAPLIGAGGSPARASGSPLRIGVLSELTGPLAAHGKRQALGARTRAAAINAAAGHGHEPTVELLIRDAGVDEAATRSAVAALLDEGVHGLVGPSTSWTGAVVAQAAQVGCTPTIIPASGPDTALPYAFYSAPPAVRVARAMVRAAKAGGATKVGRLTVEQLATEEIEEAIRSEASAAGVALGAAERFPLGATDLRAAAQKLVADKPDAILVDGPAPQHGIAVRDLRAEGWTGAVVGGPEASHPSFHPTAGPAADGVHAVVPWLVLAKDAPDVVPNVATLRRFAETFAASNGPADAQAGYGADAISLLHLAFLGHRDRKMARTQLDQMCCVGATGVFNMTPTDHSGLADSVLTTAVSVAGAWNATR